MHSTPNSDNADMSEPLLSVENLTVTLDTRDGVLPVIDQLSFSLSAGESISLVGESGCGKSMTALALMGLVPKPVGKLSGGSIKFDGQVLSDLEESKLRRIRGNDISMIFQEPMTSLNPVFTVGEQIAEVLREHQSMSRKSAFDSAIELLDSVHLPNPKQRARDYPHQLSGGQRQRVMIAIALACKPKILIADEPTTALDVTVQAQIFELLRELQTHTGTAILLITHDMGAVAEMSERMLVMYAGRKVEEGSVSDVLNEPQHPYTRGLISCVPHLVQDNIDTLPPLEEIPGIVPSLKEFGQNRCLFESRCQRSSAQCSQERPKDVTNANGHTTACWNLGGTA